jgi:hypothetical protein
MEPKPKKEREGELLTAKTDSTIAGQQATKKIWLSIIESLIVCAKPNNIDDANNCSNNDQPTLGTSSSIADLQDA